MRPLLTVWREETEAYCRAEGIEFRTDESNRDTKRGLIREEILPRLRELHPGADRNLLRLAEGRPSALDELLASTAGSKRLDLGGGLTAVREYDQRLGRADARRSQRRGALGRVADRLASSQALRYEPGVPATGSPGDRRRSRTCSSTRRSPVRPASRGRSSCAGTRSSRSRASSRRKECASSVSQTELERDVDRDPHRRGSAAVARRRARRGDLGGLRRPRPAADRRPQGRRLLHGRPDAAR